MKILRTCIIDSDPCAAQMIEKLVLDTPFLSIAGVFSSAQNAIRTVLSGNVDLLLLDIDMPQLGGLEFARIIPPTCRIIFISADDRHALQGYKVNAIDYLIKPLDYPDFLAAATKALHSFEAADHALQADRSIIVKSEYRLVQLPLRNIIYLEGVKDYVKIYLDDGSKPVMTLMNLRTLEQQLPTESFMRVHRSFIVNTTKIRIIERNRIIFGNAQIPVSESYKKEFTDYVNRRLVINTRADLIQTN